MTSRLVLVVRSRSRSVANRLSSTLGRIASIRIECFVIEIDSRIAMRAKDVADRFNRHSLVFVFRRIDVGLLCRRNAFSFTKRD